MRERERGRKQKNLLLFFLANPMHVAPLRSIVPSSSPLYGVLFVDRGGMRMIEKRVEKSVSSPLSFFSSKKIFTFFPRRSTTPTARAFILSLLSLLSFFRACDPKRRHAGHAPLRQALGHGHGRRAPARLPGGLLPAALGGRAGCGGRRRRRPVVAGGAQWEPLRGLRRDAFHGCSGGSPCLRGAGRGAGCLGDVGGAER